MTTTPHRPASSCEPSSPTKEAEPAGDEPVAAPSIGALFGPFDVGAATVVPHRVHLDSLHIDEQPPTASMVPRRQAEYAAGRACARVAMAQIGAAEASVTRTIDGTPVWPDHLTGSISHTKGICVAVAAEIGVVGGPRAIGIDVEVIERVHDGIERRILIDAERSWIEALDAEDRQMARAAVFATKEAFYKAQHQITARFLGFDVIAVELRSDRSVVLRSHSPLVTPELVDHTSARVDVVDGRVIAAVAIGRAVP